MRITLLRSAQLHMIASTIPLLFSCSGKGGKRDNASVPELPVIEVVVKDTTLNSEYVSDIQALKNVEIRARVGGFLEKIFADEGNEVKKGQPLFRLNDQELKTEVARAKANVSSAMADAKAAELEVGRTRILVEKNIISKTEYELASAKLKAAKAKIEEALTTQKSAETKLSYTYISAPFDGIIDRIPLKIGSLIDPGALLTTISDINQIYAYFHISENEYLRFKKSLTKGPQENKPLQLILADGSEYAYPGKIETIDGEFNDNTGAIAFRARFPNPNKLLKHGATGKVRLTSAVENAILIPQRSTFEIQDKNYVFVVDGKNKVTMRAFRPGQRVAQFYIVEQGLKPGEKLVYEGMQSIRQGDMIAPRFLNTDSLMKTAIEQY
ncbi:MAG TPA: efflux RND transporter periplasmic adaptor subunit [Sediminibacterium sp.]|nr:efflux RND transporter periplasmic adaptor subunit [Sediminibacterium sp.]